MKLQEALKQGEIKLEENNIADARLDAWYLMSFVTGLSRGRYILESINEMDENDYQVYMGLIAKRAQRIPLQHITGQQDFMGLSFKVNESVLIPRQDTELLVEEALKLTKAKDKVLDLCTGSGCVIISILALGEELSGVGVDISPEALKVAEYNNENLISGRAKLLQGDLYKGIEETFDIIVSNPPYIRPEVIETLEPEVKDHEPMLALDGHADGLHFYRRICQDAKKHLKEGGWLLTEIGYDQGAQVQSLFRAAGFMDVEIVKDLAKNDRLVKGHY